ncbi:Rrf2 family transcriptional regulator [Peribacillus cavernae]|uniref:Rrf2 family transcriptional regulator n=1 Tax=Peribacillus cavernae TaxID=1674310 RepID=A0A433HBZ3_9BACI|nr:Rrf2 family transcriptional regulator [Peribacillus cavernae]MDQ0219645.1 DNA-binding IscR family transcriptional regulator [Peribacillus cavernae]RUQ25930.1 Rrf2 family transcriptional regulator [Peribacillus cavernae]
MSISSRFTVGIHILVLIELNKKGISSSEFLAGSVNTNPTLIRKIMGMLKKAGLIEVQPGIAGAKLAKEPFFITLLDVYKAVDVVKEKELFSVHENPHPDCLVGRNIQDSITPVLSAAQLALEKVLGNVTIKDIVKDIVEKEKCKIKIN